MSGDDIYRVNISEIVTDIQYIKEYDYLKYHCNKLLERAKYSIDFEKREIILESYYSTKVNKVHYLLNRKCKVIVCLDSLGKPLSISKEKDVITIEHSDKFNRIYLKYSFNYAINSIRDIFINNHSGILAECIYPFEYEKIDCNTIQHNNIIINHPEPKQPSDIAIIKYNDCRFLCSVVGKNLLIKTNSINIGKKYFERLMFNFAEFYMEMFQDSVNLFIIETPEIHSLALSVKGLVLINSELCNNTSLMLHRYLFHELFHQQIGLTTKFIGYGSEWLKESITEYMQYLFFSKTFSEKINIKSLEYYKQIYFGNERFDNIPIAETYIGMPERQYNAVICSKGFFVLRTLLTYFDENEIDILKKIFNEFQLHPGGISLNIFLNIVNKLSNKDLSVYINEWVNRTGIPHYDIRWSYKSNKLIIRINQKKLLYTTPIQIGIMYKSGMEVSKYFIEGLESIIESTIQEKPIKLIIDPYIQMLCTSSILEEEWYE